MIEAVIQQVLASVPPSSGDNLLGFKIDANYYFEAHKAFTKTRVSQTQNPACLLDMRGEVAPHVSSLQEISTALIEVWQSLAYNDFQATACHWYQEATVLRFVTVISDNQFCVTGRMAIAGPHYPKLAQQFDQNFGLLLHLPSMD